MDKSHKANWTREEECSLINEIESAGEILRGSGILLTKTGSQKDWRGTNTTGQVEDEDIQLYQQIEVFLTLQIGEQRCFKTPLLLAELQVLLIFFKAPAENNEIPIASTVSAAGPVEFEDTPILESPEVEIPTIYTRKPSKKSRKRRRTVDEQDDSVELLKAADLLPLRQVDEEQRDFID